MLEYVLKIVAGFVAIEGSVLTVAFGVPLVADFGWRGALIVLLAVGLVGGAFWFSGLAFGSSP